MISPEVLRRFQLFAGVSPAVFKQLAMIGEEIEVSEGEWLFHEGDDAEGLYLIIDGEVDCKLGIGQDSDRFADVCTLVTGDLVGWSALVAPYKYTLSGIAAKDTRLVWLDAERLREMMQQDPGLGFIVMQQVAAVIAQRLAHLRIRFVSLAEA